MLRLSRRFCKTIFRTVKFRGDTGRSTIEMLGNQSRENGYGCRYTNGDKYDGERPSLGSTGTSTMAGPARPSISIIGAAAAPIVRRRLKTATGIGRSGVHDAPIAPKDLVIPPPSSKRMRRTQRFNASATRWRAGDPRSRRAGPKASSPRISGCTHRLWIASVSTNELIYGRVVFRIGPIGTIRNYALLSPEAGEQYGFVDKIEGAVQRHSMSAEYGALSIQGHVQ